MSVPILAPEAFSWTLPLDNSSQAITAETEDFNLDDYILWHSVLFEGVSSGHGIIENASAEPVISSDSPTQPDSDPRGTNSSDLQAEQAQTTVNTADLTTAPATQRTSSLWELSDLSVNLRDASNTAQNDTSLGSAGNSNFGLDLDSASIAQQIEILIGAQERTTATTNSQTQFDRKRISSLAWSKRRSQLPLAAVTVLDDWFTAHKHDPYPTPGELNRLVVQSSLTRKQVTTWLNNARARKLQQTPMEAYISSSSDDEVANHEDIRRAAESMPGFYRSSSSLPRQTEVYTTSASGSSLGSAFDQCPEARRALPTRRGRKKHVRHRSYASSRASSAGSMSSLESAHASMTALSPSCPLLAANLVAAHVRFKQYRCTFPQCNHMFSRLEDLQEHIAAVGHHFGKKASSPTKGSSEPADSDHRKKTPETMFQCTFCKIKIGEKSWKRHEESQHYSTREWTCMPNGMPVAWPSATGTCMFCGTLVHATEIHNCHRIHDCLSRPKEERTFQRKDKLVQHLNQFHSAMLDESVLKAWESKARDQSWKCGFCGQLLTTWDVRAKHIAKHFRDGFTMDHWSSGPFRDYSHEVFEDSMLNGHSQRSSVDQGIFLNGTMSSAVSHVAKMQPFYICECCPKKPKKFDSKEELE